MATIVEQTLAKIAQETASSSPLAFANDTNDTSQYLKELENASALELLPALVVLGVMSLVGDVGNVVVLYVYYTRFNPSSTRTYILSMSIVDMLFNTVTVPGEILDLRFSLTYNAAWLCGSHRFLSIFFTLASGFILVVVALVRRRKICHPFRSQLTSKHVRLSVIGCLVLAVVVSIPFGVMNGRHSVETKIPGVVGSACSVDDRFLETSFPLVYNLILAVVFLASAAAMITSYLQIARKIVRHKRKSWIGHGEGKGLAMVAARKVDNDRTTGGQTEGSSGMKGSGHNARSVSKTEDSSHYEEHRYSKKYRSASFHKTEEKSSKMVNCNIANKSFEVNGNCPASSAETAAEQENLAGGDDDVFVTKTEETKPAIDFRNNPLAAKTQCKGTDPSPSGSMRKREKEFEMAVRTLQHAVSEDMLLSHELFARHTQRPVKARSASVGDESLHVTEISELIKHKSGERIKTSTEFRNSVENRDDKGNNFTSAEPQREDNAGQNFLVGETQTKPEETETSSKSDDCQASHTSTDNTQPTPGSMTTASRSDKVHTLLRNTLKRVRSLKHEDDDIRTEAGVTSTLMRRHTRKKIPSRTTWMMFVLTAIFIISYLPYLVIISVRAALHDVEVGLSGWSLNLYTIALRSYFINSVVNPLVYSFCSARFRHQCRHILSRGKKMSISD